MVSAMEVGWPMAGLGALALGCALLAWLGSWEARALRSCGVPWREILGLPNSRSYFGGGRTRE